VDIPFENHLRLERCPHCSADKPSLPVILQAATTNSEGSAKRFWRFYACARCGGVITAASNVHQKWVDEMFPQETIVHDSIPHKARSFLSEALRTVNAPSACIMVAASSVDAMLKAKNYTEGNLYSRIDLAVADHLITKEMGVWAHQIRLEANDQRHADEKADLPTRQDAERCIDFAFALAQFLFVLPSRVQKGLTVSAPPPTKKT
jgi:hypothetical protein